MDPPSGYSISQLHAYAKANNYPEEARTLQRYLELRRRKERGRERGQQGRSGEWQPPEEPRIWLR